MDPDQADELERYCARWRHLKPPQNPPRYCFGDRVHLRCRLFDTAPTDDLNA